MKQAERRASIALAWTALPVVLPLLFAGVVVHLGALKGRVDRLQRGIDQKRSALASISVPDEERSQLPERMAQLAEWKSMITSDSERIAELSGIAWKNGVALRSLRSAQRTASADGVASCAHQLEALGTYRQIAAFLDDVYAARGLAGIDQLEIRPDGPPGSNLLLASLGVRWFAQGDAIAEPGVAQ